MKLYKPDSQSTQTFCTVMSVGSIVLSAVGGIVIFVLLHSILGFGICLLLAIACLLVGAFFYFTFGYLSNILEYLDFQSSVQIELLNKLDGQPIKPKAPQTSTKAEPTKLCSECGMDMPVDSEHCPYCGALVIRTKKNQ